MASIAGRPARSRCIEATLNATSAATTTDIVTTADGTPSQSAAYAVPRMAAEAMTSGTASRRLGGSQGPTATG